MDLVRASPDLFSPAVVINAITIAFWAFIGIGLLVRIVVALRRRGRADLRRSIGRPLMDSAAVESIAYGWTPAAQQRPEDSPSAPTTTEPTDRPSRDPRGGGDLGSGRD